ncbi:MAG TPA: maleylpyruvate isomerase family mycothiol-dependent enzyme [Streptosporangiaceae bacterium]|nr:maleylpyruvate isomerase family mycothiol-dependent enzyme [Streptosporangiaceae bacterium]
MEIGDHIAALDEHGKLLADAADRAGLDAVVPTCPGWRVRDLLRHIGYVHRWATGYVAGQLTEMVPELSEAEQLAAGPADDELIDWYTTGLTALKGALDRADPAMAAWTFLPADSPLAFWARRQAHETAIHSADAQLAAGGRPGFPADLAADGVDELLIGFFGRDAAQADAGQADAGQADARQAGPATEGWAPAAGDGRVLAVRSIDTGQAWHVRLSQDASRILATGRGDYVDGNCESGDRGDRLAADCTVSGPASGAYLLLWNRADLLAADAAVSGEPSVLADWISNMRVTWA